MVQMVAKAVSFKEPCQTSDLYQTKMNQLDLKPKATATLRKCCAIARGTQCWSGGIPGFFEATLPSGASIRPSRVTIVAIAA